MWNPGLDPLQTPWTRYLDEVQAAGYRYSELGPYGYLPTDPGVVRDEYAKRGLTLTGGTVFVALHKGRDALAQAKADCDAEMATIGPLGARHLVILPEGYTDFDGNLTASPTLTDDEWTALTTGMSELGRYVADEHGAVLVFHTHADSHVGTQDEIARFLDSTDPEAVRAVPRHRPRRLLRRRQPGDHPRLPGPHPATSTSSRSTGRSGSASVDERLGFAPAVRLGVMVEPPTGDPDMPRRARGARRRSAGTCSASSSRTCTRASPTCRCPIATRTREYFEARGLDIGRPAAAAPADEGRPMTIRVGVIGTGGIGDGPRPQAGARRSRDPRVSRGHGHQPGPRRGGRGVGRRRARVRRR